MNQPKAFVKEFLHLLLATNDFDYIKWSTDGESFMYKKVQLKEYLFKSDAYELVNNQYYKNTAEKQLEFFEMDLKNCNFELVLNPHTRGEVICKHECFVRDKPELLQQIVKKNDNVDQGHKRKERLTTGSPKPKASKRHHNMSDLLNAVFNESESDSEVVSESSNASSNIDNSDADPSNAGPSNARPSNIDHSGAGPSNVKPPIEVIVIDDDDDAKFYNQPIYFEKDLRDIFQRLSAQNNEINNLKQENISNLATIDNLKKQIESVRSIFT